MTATLAFEYYDSLNPIFQDLKPFPKTLEAFVELLPETDIKYQPAREALITWLTIILLETNFPPQTKRGDFYPTWLALRLDLEHSALLRRLLSGKPPLAQAPPKAYSYPWYSLIDEGRDLVYQQDVWEDSSRPGYLCINQSFWKVLEKTSETEYLIQWPKRLETFKLRKLPDSDLYWELFLFLPPEQSGSSQS